ncbi:MAG: hypothetical protein K2O35_03835 [Clostridia bacterium]|nr:hypothetical protein [Clostridia bacterium]
MKKMLKVFGIIAVVACLVVSVVACNGTDNSVKVVAVSDSEYASVEDALKGYVKEELALSMNIDSMQKEVDVVLAEYVSHESKGEVAESDIKLSDDQKTGFVSAEKFAVKVKIALAPNNNKDADFSEATQTVYVLKYGEKFKFMVSTPEIGERITNSYVKMLSDGSKYENCTVTAVGMEKESDDEKPVFNTAMEMKFTVEASNIVKYYDETRFNKRAPGMDEEEYDMVSYVVKNGDSIAVVNKTYGADDEVKWTANNSPMSDITTVKDYNKYLIQLNIFNLFYSTTPAALYTKTANGFEFKVEEVDSEGDKETNQYKVTVADDKITGIYMIEEYTWSANDKTYVDSFESDIKISAFGSTTVTVPSEVNAALNK